MEDMTETSVTIPMSARMKTWLEDTARRDDRSVASLGRRLILDEMVRRGEQAEAEG